VSMVKYTC